jgi:integrase
MLRDVRLKIKKEHYNWIYISVAFGLRPREVENLRLKNDNLWRIQHDSEFKYVLHVFQEKLYERGITKEKCWKYIPCVMEEQIKVIEIIQNTEFKKPIGAGAKGFRHIFGGGFTAYGGRKNFVDMLRDLGYDLETVSKWAGHLSVKTTEASYSKNTGVFYRPPVNKKLPESQLRVCA